MADWKQITARIRRARTGKDPAGQLTNLFTKTRDAMVAFELARFFESNGNPTDAGRWYLTAAERFRRADWKTKAQENATRLGATEPAQVEAPAPRAVKTAAEAEPAAAIETVISDAVEEPSREVKASAASASQRKPERESSRRRRGRRGGRERSRRSQHSPTESGRTSPREVTSASVPAEPGEAASDAGSMSAIADALPSVTLRGRSGDPGLSSRLTQLEMNFRRLLACLPAKLENADKAPAGPGVWVLTDSDLSTYYYVEACQTLRVAIPNLLRGGATRRGEASIKPLLAEHLGIPESRVGKYLTEHCVVRWLQMDEDASHFAHFLIAVLRPALNE